MIYKFMYTTHLFEYVYTYMKYKHLHIYTDNG
jgi:hypothetical protein